MSRKIKKSVVLGILRPALKYKGTPEEDHKENKVKTF